jgi:hypothetical protein
MFSNVTVVGYLLFDVFTVIESALIFVAFCLWEH